MFQEGWGKIQVLFSTARRRQGIVKLRRRLAE